MSNLSRGAAPAHLLVFSWYLPHQAWLASVGDWHHEFPEGTSVDRARLDGARLVGARLVGARLDGASLDGARLVGARLDGARLDGASLDGARLDGARLDGASLDGARLEGASLDGASLDGASLDGARLDGASLDGASLDGARLDPIRDDLFLVLDAAPNEVPALLRALEEGRVDGSTYSGECCCLVGTIANARGVNHDEIPGIVPNASRPAEVWFMAIRRGDTNGAVNRITQGWVRDWLTRHADKNGQTGDVR